MMLNYELKDAHCSLFQQLRCFDMFNQVKMAVNEADPTYLSGTVRTLKIAKLSVNSR